MRCLTIIGVLALSPLVLNANLIKNGSFESPGFSGGAFVAVAAGGTTIEHWVATQNGADWHNEEQFNFAFDGDYVVDLTFGSALGGISQTFPTEAGQSYLLSFAMAGPHVDGFEDPRSLSVEIAGSTHSFTQATSDPLGLIWGVKTLTFTAADVSTTLSFMGTGNDDYWGALIDSVSVTQASVPEAGSTLVLGAIAWAALVRLQRKAH